ncbi:cysteine-rich CWC family protein [Photobacterium nomapromontoriensis]|uniref:cysteine-rich CWC family protein n=1 Tax=Photobacterium nomapromontoriensis TaxID=2910237 RepID=UPI003D095E00
MKTPCVAKCKNHNGICSGCHRTMKELSQWPAMSDEQQDVKIEEIQGIRSTHICSQCGKPAFCEISAGHSTCWCFELDKRDISALKPGACVCRQCLEKLPLL